LDKLILLYAILLLQLSKLSD